MKIFLNPFCDEIAVILRGKLNLFQRTMRQEWRHK